LGTTENIEGDPDNPEPTGDGNIQMEYFSDEGMCDVSVNHNTLVIKRDLNII